MPIGRLAIMGLAASALALSVARADTGEAKTWYVYCEGADQGRHWAVFSKEIWHSPESGDYGRAAGEAAHDFFEGRHDVALTGCSGIPFNDDALAERSRERTVELHRKLGDRVYFFALPREVLPD